MREWMLAHAPHLVEGWALEVSDLTRTAAERTVSFYPPMSRVFSTQAPIAALAIERWNLKNVVVLGGGTPTPLSPRPDELLYYTDGNPHAVDEARQQGYRAEVVDIGNRDDYNKIPGVTTAVATGLFHFLPDEAARAILRMFIDIGFTTFVFNNMRYLTSIDQGSLAVVDDWSKFGLNLYPRTPEQVAELLSGTWHLQEIVPVLEFYHDHPDYGPLFADESDNFSNIYLVTAP